MTVGTATSFEVTAPIGLTLSATARKFTPAGTLTDYWNNATGAWVDVGSPPSFADADIALVEGTGIAGNGYPAGTYHPAAAIADWASYTGRIKWYVHVTSTEVAIGQSDFYVSSGVPVDDDLSSMITAVDAGTTVSPVVISEARTFFMHDSIDGSEAPNIIEIPAGSATTLAFDFSRILNPDQGVASGGVVVASGSAISFASEAANGSATQLHSTLTPTGTGDRTLTCTITTTDSQPLVGTAYLQVS